MKEFLLLSADDLLQVSSYVCDSFEEGGGALKVQIKRSRTRSLSQNAFHHVIYQEISKYLTQRGREDWTPEYTKKNLKNKFLGWVTEEFVDVSTGERTTRETLRHTSSLDVGEAYQYTTQILDWAESTGCFIKIPADCEYRELMEQQND